MNWTRKASEDINSDFSFLLWFCYYFECHWLLNFFTNEILLKVGTVAIEHVFTYTPPDICWKLTRETLKQDVK